MFVHFEKKSSKCEWLANDLKGFVEYYNKQSGTAYLLTECLDLARTSGTTPKAPEVLITGSDPSDQMVIERKSVEWPPKYIRSHQWEHEFAESIWEKTGGLYCDGSYELSLDGREFATLSRKGLQQAGEQIAERIKCLDCRDLPFQSASPINWTFRKVGFDAEGSDRKGIIVIHREPEFMTLEDIDSTAAQEGTRSEMNKQIQAAAEKFASYSHCRRLVLLDFYGTALCESDIPPLLDSLSIPPVIDEVWRTTQLWISEEEFEVGYQRLYAVGRK